MTTVHGCMDMVCNLRCSTKKIMASTKLHLKLIFVAKMWLKITPFMYKRTFK